MIEQARDTTPRLTDGSTAHNARGSEPAYVNVRHRLAEVIEREYGLADPANEGYRPEAFTLAGALLNALCADRATPPLPHPTILLRAVLLCSDSTPESVVQCDADGTCPVHKDGACALWYVPWADAKRSAEADEQLRADLAAVRAAEQEAWRHAHRTVL